MSKDLELAIEAAKQAGKIIKDNYYKTKTITEKGLDDFVTETDTEAEKVILEHLKQTGYSILAEETGETDNQSTKKWVIDPLDGTTNFIRDIPFFAVSIALIENDKDLILGVVYNPISDECFYAEKNMGAYLNDRKISVQDKGDFFRRSRIIFDYNRSPKSRNDYVQAITQIMKKDIFSAVTYGSTALELCYLAKASNEAFMSCGDKLYDYAGGLIIAKEAGAEISDWNGKPWDNSNSYILAVNPKIREELLNTVKGIQQF